MADAQRDISAVNSGTGRFLCRHVWVDGKDSGLCLVTLYPDNHVTVSEFECETHSTRYVDGEMHVFTDAAGRYRLDSLSMKAIEK